MYLNLIHFLRICFLRPHKKKKIQNAYFIFELGNNLLVLVYDIRLNGEKELGTYTFRDPRYEAITNHYKTCSFFNRARVNLAI